MKQYGHLPGLHEISNYSNGFIEHVPTPKLIGDPAKAQALLEAGNAPLALTHKPENMRGECRVVSGLLQSLSAKNILNTKHETESL